MLGLAKRVGARFLLTSTSEVYGDPLQHPQVETYWGNVNPIGTFFFLFCFFCFWFPARQTCFFVGISGGYGVSRVCVLSKRRNVAWFKVSGPNLRGLGGWCRLTVWCKKTQLSFASFCFETHSKAGPRGPGCGTRGKTSNPWCAVLLIRRSTFIFVTLWLMILWLFEVFLSDSLGGVFCNLGCGLKF